MKAARPPLLEHGERPLRDIAADRIEDCRDCRRERAASRGLAS
jgi:hypothetical protein